VYAFCRNSLPLSLSLSLSFLSLSHFFFFSSILLDITIVFTAGPAFTSSSPFYTLQLSLAVASFTIRPISKEGQSSQLASKDFCLLLFGSAVCFNNNLLDVFISSNLAAAALSLYTTNFLVFSPINHQGAPVRLL
jgi:hypothetical protein